MEKSIVDREVQAHAERYGLSWPGQALAAAEAVTPPKSVMKPVAEESTGGAHTGNLYIEGDNLEALKQLQPTYAGQVDCIYIDPPYNTGNEFIYRDRFQMPKRDGIVDDVGALMHSAWLSMMYPRLLLARELMSEQGVIFISIDDHEVANLRKLCDQVFGEECFGGQVVVQTNRGGQDYLQLAKTHEYLLCYFKSGNGRLRPLPRTDLSSFRYEDEAGKYELRELRNRNPKFHRGNRPNLYYPIYVNPDAPDEYGCCPISLTRHASFPIEIFPLNSRGRESCWRWGKEKLAAALAGPSPTVNVVARQKRGGGWNIYEKNRKLVTKAKTIWDEPEMRTERGTAMFRELFGELYFDHPKPVELIQKAIRIGTDPDSIVLDFFSGSATTAHAVMQQNAEDGGSRKYILVQLPEVIPADSAAGQAGFRTICDIGKMRIRKAAARIQEQYDADIDYGFQVFRIET